MYWKLLNQNYRFLLENAVLNFSPNPGKSLKMLDFKELLARVFLDQKEQVYPLTVRNSKNRKILDHLSVHVTVDCSAASEWFNSENALERRGQSFSRVLSLLMLQPHLCTYSKARIIGQRFAVLKRYQYLCLENHLQGILK